MKARLPRWAASMPCSRRMSRSLPRRAWPTASTRVTTARRGPTATACSRRPARSALERGHALHWSYPVDFANAARVRRAARRHPRLHRLHADRHLPRPLRARGLRGLLAAGARVDHDLLEFWIEADTFMRHMNRTLVGTMLDVARGRLSVGGLRAAARRRSARGSRSHRARARAVLCRRRLPRRAAAQPARTERDQASASARSHASRRSRPGRWRRRRGWIAASAVDRRLGRARRRSRYCTQSPLVVMNSPSPVTC